MNKTRQTKTLVFNVFILDKSGSMGSIRQAAVSGFNETLNGIKQAQEKYAETQEHFVSLVAFCSCETTQIFDNVPVIDARHLTMEDYQPCCCTPLYDAMGFTLTTMRKYVNSLKDTVVVVTIMTDGMENDSKEYTGAAIKELVEQLKGEGWTFTYMGANQDSTEIAFNLSIHNSRNFDYSKHGTIRAIEMDTNTRLNFYGRLHAFRNDVTKGKAMSVEERNASYSAMANEAFDEEEGKV